MNTYLIAIAGAAVVILVILIVVLILKKKATAKKEAVNEVAEEITELAVEDLVEVEEVSASEEVEQDADQSIQEVATKTAPPQPEETAEDELAIEPEPEEEEPLVIVAEQEQEPEPEEEEPLVIAAEQEQETEPEPELELQAETEPEPELELQAEPEPEPELAVQVEPEQEPELQLETASGEDTAEQEQAGGVTITLESYEQRLLTLREQQLAALARAIENNEESKREKLQLMVVTITEALTFFKQSYEQEIACRNEVLAAMETMEPEIDGTDFARACEDIRSQSTEGAEKILDTLAQQKTANSAAAMFHSGRLAECRMDFHRAMLRLDKAVEIDGKNPDYLRAAGLLARKLYQHKKALIRFIALEKLIDAKGEDSVELALVRRELAYCAALFGKHKQAGSYYKKAMGSLAKLLGKDDPEMGICWLQIGKLQETLGHYEKAEAPYKQALAIIGKTDDDIVLADVLDKLARLLMELDGEPDAIPLFERLCAIKEKSPHPDQAGLIIIYNNIAEAYRICGKYEDSENNYQRALTITQELRGKDHPAVASIYQELAKLCDRQRKPDEAKKYQEMSAAIFQRVLEEQEAAGDKEERLTL